MTTASSIFPVLSLPAAFTSVLLSLVALLPLLILLPLLNLLPLFMLLSLGRCGRSMLHLLEVFPDGPVARLVAVLLAAKRVLLLHLAWIPVSRILTLVGRQGGP